MAGRDDRLFRRWPSSYIPPWRWPDLNGIHPAPIVRQTSREAPTESVPPVYRGHLRPSSLLKFTSGETSNTNGKDNTRCQEPPEVGTQEDA